MNGVPIMLAGLDPTRAFRTDFSKMPAIIMPTRRTPQVGTSSKERTTYVCEATCAHCGKDFTRRIPLGSEEPRFCSNSCANTASWRRRSRHGHSNGGRPPWGAQQYPRGR